MIFLFRDNMGEETEWLKINSENKEEALLKALKNMLSEAVIDVDSICANLDLELIDPTDLKEYE
jgi:hypothetical protein